MSLVMTRFGREMNPSPPPIQSRYATDAGFVKHGLKIILYFILYGCYLPRYVDIKMPGCAVYDKKLLLYPLFPIN